MCFIVSNCYFSVNNILNFLIKFFKEIVPSMSKFKKNNNIFKTELNFFHLSNAFEKDIAHFSKKQKTFNLKVII